MIRVRLRTDEVERLAGRLERGGLRARLVLAAARAVNETATEFNDDSIDAQTRDINLTPAYVKSKTDLTLASPAGRARAEILTRGDLTVLGNFAPLSRVVAPGAIRKAGPIKGFRSAGTRVAIRRSKYLTEDQWFIMPLRRGLQSGGNGFGVFVRDPKLSPSPKAKREGRHGKRHIYGPSPYAMARTYIDKSLPQLRERLATRALRLMGDGLVEEVR